MGMVKHISIQNELSSAYPTSADLGLSYHGNITQDQAKCASECKVVTRHGHVFRDKWGDQWQKFKSKRDHSIFRQVIFLSSVELALNMDMEILSEFILLRLSPKLSAASHACSGARLLHLIREGKSPFSRLVWALNFSELLPSLEMSLLSW